MSQWQKRTLSRGTIRDQVMSVAVSPDARTIAVGGYDGLVNVFDTGSLTMVHGMAVAPPKEERPSVPVSALAFRPVPTKPLLMACTSSGVILRYNARTWELSRRIVEEDNEIYACDYDVNGSFFVTCGRDACVRVYNDQTEHLAHVFTVAPEHTTNTQPLRMFSVRFSRQNPNLILAGGWGSAVFSFDMRELEVETRKHGAIFGPYMTGDGLDVVDNTVLACSHRVQERVTLFDIAPEVDPLAEKDESANAGHTAPSGGPIPVTALRTAAPLSALEAASTAGKFATVEKREVPWPLPFEFLPHCGKLSPDGRYVAVGGAGGEGMLDGGFVIGRSSKKAVVELKTTKSVNCCAFAPEGQFVVFGDGASQIHVYENKHFRATTA